MVMRIETVLDIFNSFSAVGLTCLEILKLFVPAYGWER